MKLNKNKNNINKFNKDDFIKDALAISQAIEDGSLDLSPDEEVRIKSEIEEIFKAMDVDENKISEFSKKDDVSGVVGDVVSSDDVSSNDIPDITEKSYNNFKENDSSEEITDLNSKISVDDALNELVDDYSDKVAIKVENLTMEFKISRDKIDSIKEFVIRTLKRNKSKSTKFTALKDISFEIPKGDRVGIIGFNGAGKSTLLKILAGVYDPTEGKIATNGKIAPLLELGAGFDPNYTGKANIFLNGAFLGYSEDFIKEKYDEIVEFSELGEAINYSVRTYSSGMYAKLGFAIATIVEPDILIIDEILSVGDIRFRRKSHDKIKSLINSGVTVLLVSHTVSQIRALCNKAIWIDEGELRMMGDVDEVCDAYVEAAKDATNDQLKNLKMD